MSTKIEIGKTGLTEAVRRIHEHREKVRVEAAARARRAAAEYYLDELLEEEDDEVG